MEIRRLASCTMAAAFVMTVAATAARAEERVQNETITINDPTQSTGAWKYQVGAEWWYMRFADPRYNYLGITGTIHGGEVGLSGSASHGRYTFMLSVRDGRYGEEFPATAPATHNKMDTLEIEGKLRYLLNDSDWWGFTPYVLGGLHYIGANSHFRDSATPTEHYVQNYESIELGLGLMKAFNDRWGMRTDLSAAGTFGNSSDQYFTMVNNPTFKHTGNGFGGNYYLTVYYKATEHVIAQMGVRAGKADAGQAGNLWALGAYMSLAYSFGE